MTTFPEKPNQAYTLNDLTSYLLQIQSMGFNVYRSNSQENVFEIEIDQVLNIRCSFQNGSSQIQLRKFENMINFLNVKNKYQLQNVIEDFFKQAMGSFPTAPKTARLSEETPSTNYQSIANLIGSSEVLAVFDPYLENSSLNTLINICSFGMGKIGNNVRILGSKKKARGANPKFTHEGVNAFLIQSNIIGVAKIMTSETEHRRFILLSGGQSLLLGHSLNAIHKNEAIRIEADTEDIVFFNNHWENAEML